MATLRVDLGRPRDNGQMMVYFILSHKGTKKRFPTPIYVDKSDISYTKKGLKFNNLKKKMAIDHIEKEINDRIYDIAIDISMSDCTAEDIVNMIKNKSAGEDFLSYADRFASRNQTNVQLTNQAIKSIRNFDNRLRIPFASFTRDYLDRYCLFMKDKPVAMAKYLAIIKKIYLNAEDDFNNDAKIIIPRWSRYKIPSAPPSQRERSITADEMKMIYDYSGTLASGMFRDYFILSFCLLGTNLIDFFGTDIKIKNGYLCYHRQKTRKRRIDGAYIEIKIPDYILPLIQKRRGSKRTFDLYEHYNSYQSAKQSLNSAKMLLERKFGIAFSFYSARHTWATIAHNDVGIDKATINDALNHIDADMKVTDIYIKKSFKAINEANEKVMQYMFKNYFNKKD